MMNASQAAAALLKELHAPRGAVTIMPRTEKGTVILEVLLDERATYFSDRVPSEFEGYRIIVQKRKPFRTLALN